MQNYIEIYNQAIETLNSAKKTIIKNQDIAKLTLGLMACYNADSKEVKQAYTDLESLNKGMIALLQSQVEYLRLEILKEQIK